MGGIHKQHDRLALIVDVDWDVKYGLKTNSQKGNKLEKVHIDPESKTKKQLTTNSVISLSLATRFPKPNGVSKSCNSFLKFDTVMERWSLMS